MAQAALTRPQTTTPTAHSNWFAIGLLVVVVALVAGFAGYAFAQSNITNSDVAFQKDVTAAWSNTADSTKLADLYWTGAVVRTADGTTILTGVPAIQAYVADSIAHGATVTPVGEPMRSGDTVAMFVNSDVSGTSTPLLAVFELNNDGKILTQTVYAVH